VIVAVVTLAVLATGASVAYLRSQSAQAHASSALAGLAGGKGTAANQIAAPAAGTQTTPAARTVAVARLGRLYLPDAIVTASRPITPAQLAGLRAIPGIQGLTTALRGTTTLGTRRVNVLAVDPGTFRAFTPRPTAASDPLWQVPARGEAIASYELNKRGKLPLGGRLRLGHVPNMRIGALAEFSLPKVDVVVSATRDAAVGAVTPVVLVSDPSADEAVIKAGFTKVLGGAVTVDLVRPTFTPVQVTGSTTSGGNLTANSPIDLRTLYMRAATTCPGLPWGVLAGIGQVETDHGRVKAISSAGAEGPMQFMPSTWAIYGVDGDGDGKADIFDQADAVYSAARYLCASGGGQPDTLYDAIYAYNHSDYYVRTVLGLAAQDQ
jgi:Transglycosylase SLT domain